jgi:hypothetical protein
MNCPFCQSPFKYERVGGNRYYRVICSRVPDCRSESNERLFFGFADNYPDKTITEYSLFITVGNSRYIFTSMEVNRYSSIEYETGAKTEILAEWNEWIPLQPTLELYLAKIQRYDNLKAFW